MPVVTVFRLTAPIAAFGDLAVGERRGSFARPSHGAITGLLAGALGIAREDPGHEDLAGAFLLAVRTDAPGRPFTDYHTAQMPPARRGRSFATRRDELADPLALGTVVSRRDYLLDVDFTVVLWPTTSDDALPRTWADALNRPVFAPYAGRRSCPLGAPVQAMAVEADTITDALRRYDAGSSHEAAGFAVPRRSETTLAFDAALADRFGAEAGLRHELRRDRLLSRSRWQFGPRSEYVTTLGPVEPNA